MSSTSTVSSGEGRRTDAQTGKNGLLFTNLSSTTRHLKERLERWSRKNSSLWPLMLDLSCCSAEVTDLAYGADAKSGGFRFTGSPERSDVMIVSGWITKSMAPELRKLYNQMLRPKYVIAYGSCAACGGPWWESYNVLRGVDQILPVDVYVAGCPPRPEDLLDALMKLQKKAGGRIDG